MNSYRVRQLTKGADGRVLSIKVVTNDVREINQAVSDEARGKRVNVTNDEHGRIIAARTRQGQFQVQPLAGQRWTNATNATIVTY